MSSEQVPQAVDEPLVMNVTLVIEPEHREQYLSALREVLPPARAEAACVHLDVGEVADRPGTFVLFEHWRSAKEYVEEILRLPYFQRYLEITEPLYAVPRTVLVLTPVVAGGSAADTGS
jgi:quinol monooxygenase YgiN